MIGQMIEAFTLALDIPIQSVGSMTLRASKGGRGIQPDRAYYFANEPRVHCKDTYDPQKDPPPDLVIEVDVTSSSVPRMPVLTKIGVPEVWRLKRRPPAVLSAEVESQVRGGRAQYHLSVSQARRSDAVCEAARRNWRERGGARVRRMGEEPRQFQTESQMDAVEHMVEAYFRICRQCFTMHDVKVEEGNNRQFDLLAVEIRDSKICRQYHVEASVMPHHAWCPTPDELALEFERKFLGMPRRTDGENCDFAKGKSYREQIENAYKRAGLDPTKLERVWVCWKLRNPERLAAVREEFRVRSGFSVEVVSFRDRILAELEERIGSANYDDEILRT